MVARRSKGSRLACAKKAWVVEAKARTGISSRTASIHPASSSAEMTGAPTVYSMLAVTSMPTLPPAAGTVRSETRMAGP